VQSVLRRIPIAIAPALGGIAIARYGTVGRSLPGPIRWLLASDIFIRTCEGLVDVFLVLHAINVLGVSAPAYGVLLGVQATTAIVSCIPGARLADRVGRKPFVIATFVAFAAFPVAVVLAHSFATLVAAFVVGGLREIGEPARKAMIVDLVRPSLRARSVGLYCLVRSVAIAPAAFVGGLLRSVAPALPFWVAGVAVFAATVDARDAS
jgi:MFS family permease